MRTPGGSAGSQPDPPAELKLLSTTLPTRAWREEALVRAVEIQALSDWVDKLREQGQQEQLGEKDADADKRLADAIKIHVAAVYKAASGGRPRMHTSARLARATNNIHAAETNLLRRAPLEILPGRVAQHGRARAAAPADRRSAPRAD
jgi:hypothetical protein